MLAASAGLWLYVACIMACCHGLRLAAAALKALGLELAAHLEKGAGVEAREICKDMQRCNESDVEASPKMQIHTDLRWHVWEKSGDLDIHLDRPRVSNTLKVASLPTEKASEVWYVK